MRSKWRDFLFTLAVRAICGLVLGALVSLLLCAPMAKRVRHGSPALIVWVFGDEAHPKRPYYWIGTWAMVGALIALVTMPKWQTPWYKRNKSDWQIQIVDESHDDKA